MCGIAVQTVNGRIVSIEGDRDDPFSRGHICPKAVALQDVYHDPDRLKRPVRRGKTGWEEISWKEAFDEVAAKLTAIQQKYGRDAVAFYLGNPTVHNTGSLLFAPVFLRTLRTKNRFSATSADQLPHQLAAYLMFGHQLLLPVPDIDRSDYFLILGANPLVSNGSMMTAGGIEARLKALRQRGGKVVVVDPRRTETARKADAHYFIRPGTDVLLLLALLHTLFNERFIQPGRLDKFLNGLEEVESLASDFPAEKVAPATGISAEDIRGLARDFAAARSAVCYGRFGVSTQPFGALCQWLINVLNAVTGNLDRPGGAMFTLPAVDIVKQTAKQGRRGSLGRWKSRVRGLPEAGGELPVAVLAEEIDTDGPGQVKALITVAGNPVLSTPNGARLERALSQLEFMVAVDIYINETTRHANIILPPTTGLETSHYDLVFHLLAVRNTARYAGALMKAEKGAMHDWQIFKELQKRMEARKPPKSLINRLQRTMRNRLTPERMLDLGLRVGPYGIWGGRLLSPGGLSLKKLKKHPHGIDLGPLKPCLPGRLFTSDKRIHLAPKVFREDIKRVKSTFFRENKPKPAGFDLLLIGRRQLRDNNSWMHNSPRLVKGKNRCTLLMNPSDADARRLTNGQTVEVSSRVGKINIEVKISDEMMPGVVSIPHGWGHSRDGVRLQIARQHPGVSINDLTDEQRVDELSGNAAFSAVPVKVAAEVCTN